MTTTNTHTPSTTIAGFDVIGATIAALQEKFKDVQHDVTTTAGLAAEKKDRAELRGYRLQVEEKRVELKAPFLASEREIDEHARKLSNAISALESARDKRIKDEEARKAAAKRAIEDAERAERDRVAAVEREAAAAREADLKAQLAAAQAALAAAKPVAVESENPAPEGWAFIEGGFEHEPQTIAGMKPLGEVLKVRAPAGHDDGLLDLLAASESHTKHTQRSATGFVLPTANEVADALSSRAKRRTTILHVTDVLEAIRAISAAQ